MDRDTDLFVQAFWVMCRETVRPEFDRAAASLQDEGHTAHIATQEYGDGSDGLPDGGPALILTVHLKGDGAAYTLRFQGAVATESVEVLGSLRAARRYEMANVDDEVVRRELAGWLAKVFDSHS